MLEPQFADTPNTIWRNEAEQRQGGCIAQQSTHRCWVGPRRSGVQLVDGGDSCTLDVLPGQPSSDTRGLVHLLLLARLLGLISEVDDAIEWVGVRVEHRIVRLEVRVTKGRDAHQPGLGLGLGLGFRVLGLGLGLGFRVRV